MKVVFLNLYAKKIARGAESFSHELCRQLESLGMITLMLKGDSEIMPKSHFEGSWSQKLLKRCFLDKPGREVLRFSLRILPSLFKQSPDWIIPLNGFWQLLLCKIAAPSLGSKVLVTGHSGPGWDERWNLYLQPDVFIATTGPMRDWAKKTSPWTDVELIPYGIDRDWGMLHKGSRLKSNIENRLKKLETPIILCPTALVPYKRVELAIKAVSQLNKGSLVVVGKGELDQELAILGERLLPGRFLLTSVTYDKMPLLFHYADVVTLPSSPQENSPMVFVEALASGKKVVATDAPRVRWALQKAGFYIDPTNIDEYRDTLVMALRTKVDTSKPLKKFLWEHVLKAYKKVLVQSK